MDSKAKSGDPSKLTEKQRQFVREFLVDLNATQAAIRCGYSPKAAKQQGSRLLTYANVIAAIEIAKTERAKRKNIDQDYVLDVIQKTIERCSQAEPVLDREGNPTGEYKFDSSAVLKGAELLGRHLGTWNDKLKLQGDADNPLVGFFSDLQGTGLRVKR
jgi:phage terminase small subunit